MQGYEPQYAALGELAKRAHRDLTWSRIFLYFGAVICAFPGLIALIGSIASLGQVGGGAIGTLALALLVTVAGGAAGAYVYWGFYWGWVAIWRWLRRLMGGSAPGSSLNGLAFLIFVIVFVWLLATIASWYGILGGGIYQYRKAKQIVAAAL